MGHYLNPGNEAFRRALRSKIYIDKTGMIRYLNSVIGTDDGFVCVSRPRRFGKSMAANMLAAYYGRTCDSREIFAGKNISRSESCEEHRNQYDVIFLNIQHILGAAGSPEAVVTFLQKAVLEELQEEYSDLVEENETHLSAALADIYVQNPEGKRGFVFIIDEWDCMFREAKNDTSSQKQYLDFLKDLFKDRTYVALAYMTGILPIKKYGTHSALNIFDEYSMTDPDIFAEYAGFTEEETRKLCEEYERDFDEIKKWYDGYLFPGGLHIYNPKSVVDAMKSRRLKSFWTSTETYEALQLYIDLNEDGLKEALTEMLIGQSCKVDTGSFQNDMMSLKSRDDVLTLLVHLGYLAYDESSRSVYIPNEEVRGEFIRAVRNGGRPDLFRLLQASDELMEATLRMVMMLAYIGRADDYRIYQELPAGTGYADIVLQPKLGTYPPVIVELKWDESAKGAIAQIKERNYMQGIDNDAAEILLVAVSYDKDTKAHSCKIERFTKGSEEPG